MEEFKNLQETKLTSQPIFDGDVLHIYKDTVRLPNGKTSTREYTVHHGAVCILPLLENGDVLLERQFRYAMGEVLTEIPAGKLDYIGEDPREAALRELREETGAVASELIPLGPFYPTCAYSTEVIQMFLAWTAPGATANFRSSGYGRPVRQPSRTQCSARPTSRQSGNRRRRENQRDDRSTQ